jgi:hypothetical protein
MVIKKCASVGCTNEIKADGPVLRDFCGLCLFFITFGGTHSTHADWGKLTTEEAMGWIL